MIAAAQHRDLSSNRKNEMNEGSIREGYVVMNMEMAENNFSANVKHIK